MLQRWCSLCYHSNRNENGIVGTNEVDLHYYSLHRATQHEWPHTKSYKVKFTNENKAYLYDDIACIAPQSKCGEQLFLQHIKTDKNIINKIQFNKSYAIGWYGKPYRSARFNHDWCISTLWCAEPDNLFTVPIKQLHQYPDLIKKLESQHRDIMDDIMDRSPANLSNMTFKHKSLAILREIKKCQTWTKYFLKPVNEQQDSAPNYYKIIENPMDMESLKTLIECNTIKTPKQFCANLMLIWKNAQAFNPKHHKIHKYASKCVNESHRLIQKYFPQLYNNNINNNIACVKYKKDIRECLLCCVCDKRLELLIGFHTNCNRNRIQWGMNGNNGVNCNKCNRDLCDTSIGYYHCMAGCESNDHCIFLCEICAGDERYKYDSKQIPNSFKCADLPFNGLWVDIGYNYFNNKIWYEVITCYQEANRIEYEIVFSSENMSQKGPFGKTCGTIMDNNELKFQIDCHKYTDFKEAKLNIDHSILRFIDSDNLGQNQNQNVYRKVKSQCGNCNNSEMLFMRKNTIPSTDIASVIYCDIHKDYYEKNREMNEEERCLSFNVFKYDNLNKNKIPQIAFYFTCTQCNNFDICAGCILISVEQNFTNKHLIKQENTNHEPPQKRVRVTAITPSASPGVDNESKSKSISNVSMEDYNVNSNNLPLMKPKRIRSKIVAKKQNNNRKRKRSEFEMGDSENNTRYKELYLKEKEKNEKLLFELKKSNDMQSFWESKHDKLLSKVQGVLDNDRKLSPPPLCT